MHCVLGVVATWATARHCIQGVVETTPAPQRVGLGGGRDHPGSAMHWAREVVVTTPATQGIGLEGWSRPRWPAKDCVSQPAARECC